MSDLIPEGSYEAVAYKVNTEDFGDTYAQLGYTPEKGTPQVAVNVEIVDEGDHKGKRIAYIGWLTEAAILRTIESLRYFGFRGNDLAGLVTQRLDQKVQIVVKHETYEGRVRAKVAWVNRAGGGSFKLTQTMDKDSLRAFAAKMKGAVSQVPDNGVTPKAASSGRLATRAASPPSPETQRGPAPPPPDDSDIPF